MELQVESVEADREAHDVNAGSNRASALLDFVRVLEETLTI